MKFKLLLLLSLSTFGISNAQTWINGGNGIQYYYDGTSTRHVRQVLTAPQPPFGVTDSLNKKTNLNGSNAQVDSMWPINVSGSSFYHNGYSLDGGGPYDTGFDYIFARTTGTQQMRMITPTGLAERLGYGNIAVLDSSYFNLQRVTGFGNTTTNTIVANGGGVFRGSIGGNGLGRTDAQLEITNQFTGGHALISLHNKLANDEAGFTFSGTLSDGSIRQTAAQGVFYPGSSNTVGNYRTAMVWHLPDAFGDKEPMIAYSNNSMKFLAGNTSSTPYNTVPPDDTMQILGSVTVAGNLTSDGYFKSTAPKSFESKGILGNPSYMLFDQTAQTGGKAWRLGNSGGSTLTTFDLLNLTDGILALTVSASGNATFSNPVSVGAPVASGNATTKAYVDGKILTVSATIDIPSITAGGTTTVNVTVTGASPGDVCVFGTDAYMPVQLTYQCRVTSSNTVSILVYNSGTGAIDPDSTVFKVKVFKD